MRMLDAAIVFGLAAALVFILPTPWSFVVPAMIALFWIVLQTVP